METRGRREEPPDQCPPRDNTRLLPRYPRADNLQARAHARREEREREFRREVCPCREEEKFDERVERNI